MHNDYDSLCSLLYRQKIRQSDERGRLQCDGCRRIWETVDVWTILGLLLSQTVVVWTILGISGMLHEREFGRNDSVLGPRDGPFNPANKQFHGACGHNDPRVLSYQVQMRDLHNLKRDAQASTTWRQNRWILGKGSGERLSHTKPERVRNRDW